MCLMFLRYYVHMHNSYNDQSQSREARAYRNCTSCCDSERYTSTESIQPGDSCSENCDQFDFTIVVQSQIVKVYYLWYSAVLHNSCPSKTTVQLSMNNYHYAKWGHVYHYSHMHSHIKPQSKKSLLKRSLPVQITNLDLNSTQRRPPLSVCLWLKVCCSTLSSQLQHCSYLFVIQ